MRPQPPAAGTPPPPPASPRTSSNLGALGLGFAGKGGAGGRRQEAQCARDDPGGGGPARGRRREAARAKLEAGGGRAKERRAGPTEAPGGVSRPGGDADRTALRPAGPGAGGGAQERASGRPRFLMQSSGGGGARARGRGLSPLGFSPFASLRVFSPRDANLGTAAGWARPRPAGVGRSRGAGPATVRPRRPPAPDAPPGSPEKRPKFAGRAAQPAPAASPRAPGLPSLPGIVRQLCSSAPRPHLGGGRAWGVGPGWAGMGGGPGQDAEPGPAARAREQRL